uniref:Ceramide synthase 3 n=1 Tax=Crocodylus porosus TaxID=8502 RepID=A0A7M4FI60_CROPO
MAYIFKTLKSWFWWETIWMPANVTWADFEDRDGYTFPKPHQLYACIPITLVLLIIRFFTEKYIALPLAKALDIKNVRQVKPQPNSVLEAYFRSCTRRPSQSEMLCLAKKCNWTVHLVQKWFKRRRNLEIPSFYFATYLLLCSLLPSQYWYYMVEISFYCSLLCTLGMDNKRKDFIAHVIHHLAAIGLMGFSWCANYLRIGTLVLIIHDIADFWLEAAKMFNYARWEKTCNVLFLIFSVMFFITRIILFPLWILRGTIILPLYYSTTPVLAYFLINGQLLALQGLHLYWGNLILDVLKKFIFVGVSNFGICQNVKDVDKLESSKGQKKNREAEGPGLIQSGKED